MNIFSKFYCRVYQTFFKIAYPFLPYKVPVILDQPKDVCKILRQENVRNVLLVSDISITNLGLTNELKNLVSESGVNVFEFLGVLPNPTIAQVEEGLKVYNNNNCSAIIAFGGGSVIDTAKIIGARAVCKNKSVYNMKGLLKIGKKIAPIIAVPTTAGTGSETTITSVITDEKTHNKFTINDFNLIPKYALLDYKVTIGLPKHITSTTGLDALTHAVEAYIGRSTTKITRKYALDAVKLIHNNLLEAYNNGTNIVARQNMLKASYLAGLAFTRSYVGYVHAIAHTLGGKYGVPHGLANAVVLPYVLEAYGKSVVKKLALLADVVGLRADTNELKAIAFISYIRSLNREMDIPNGIKELKEEDINSLAKIASKEANPLYPVPKLFNSKELENIYKKLIIK